MKSIEWSMQEIMGKDFRLTISDNDLNKYQQAVEMHKQEIIDAFGVGSQFDRDYLYGYHDKAEQYYQETFVSKGSDDKKINLVEIPQEQLEKERNPNYKYFNIDEPKLPQQEISDEEIEKVSATLDYDHISEIVMWEKGARWYREQLKNKSNG